MRPADGHIAEVRLIALEVNHPLSVYDVLPLHDIAMAVHHDLDTRVVRRGRPLSGKWQIHSPVFGTEAKC
jgi:hypothetical protein